MPLVSVQTKLSTILSLAQQARGSAAYYVQRFGDGSPVQTQELVSLAKQFREITSAAAAFANDAAVSAEADRQFAGQTGWQNGSLLALLAAVLPMTENAVAAAKAAVPSYLNGTVPALSSWNPDGTTSPVSVASQDVQVLRTILSGIVSTIPE